MVCHAPLGNHGEMSEVNVQPDVCKLRLRFSKAGDIRFLSHHDLMRLMERLMRRAQIPFRSTEGFNPKPKITFASALSLGIVGHKEVVELELDGKHDAVRVLITLNELAPEGLDFLSGDTVPVRSTAQPVRAIYFYPLPPVYRPDISDRLSQLMLCDTLVIDRIRNVLQAPARAEPLAEERLDALTTAEPLMTRVEVKKLDIKPFIHRLWRDSQGYWMDVAITNHGAIRPEELLRLVDLENHMLDGESVLERTELFLEDELPAAKPAVSSGAVPCLKQGDLQEPTLTQVPVVCRSV